MVYFSNPGTSTARPLLNTVVRFGYLEKLLFFYEKARHVHDPTAAIGT